MKFFTYSTRYTHDCVQSSGVINDRHTIQFEWIIGDGRLMMTRHGVGR